MQQSNPQPTLFDQIWLDECERQDGEQKAQAEEVHSQKAQEQKAIDSLQQSSQQARAIELLGILTELSQEHGKEVISKAGGVLELARLPEEVVATLPHIGPKRAKQIKAMTEWAKLVSAPDDQERMQIRSPVDAANLLMLEMSLLEREQLRVIGLDTKNNVSFIDTIYSGSLNSAVVRIAEVLRMAVIMNSASIILVHNHPSGDVSPSPEDIRVTELIRESGKTLDIEVMDHLIIGKNRFVSLKERGVGFG